MGPYWGIVMVLWWCYGCVLCNGRYHHNLSCYTGILYCYGYPPLLSGCNFTSQISCLPTPSQQQCHNQILLTHMISKQGPVSHLTCIFLYDHYLNCLQLWTSPSKPSQALAGILEEAVSSTLIGREPQCFALIGRDGS